MRRILTYNNSVSTNRREQPGPLIAGIVETALGATIVQTLVTGGHPTWSHVTLGTFAGGTFHVLTKGTHAAIVEARERQSILTPESMPETLFMTAHENPVVSELWDQLVAFTPTFLIASLGHNVELVNSTMDLISSLTLNLSADMMRVFEVMSHITPIEAALVPGLIATIISFAAGINVAYRHYQAFSKA